jgi:hypothetical protein
LAIRRLIIVNFTFSKFSYFHQLNFFVTIPHNFPRNFKTGHTHLVLMTCLDSFPNFPLNTIPTTFLLKLLCCEHPFILTLWNQFFWLQLEVSSDCYALEMNPCDTAEDLTRTTRNIHGVWICHTESSSIDCRKAGRLSLPVYKIRL